MGAVERGAQWLTLAFAIFLEAASTAYAAGETVSMNTIDANGVVKKIGTLRRTPSNWCPIMATATAQYYLASELILRRRV